MRKPPALHVFAGQGTGICKKGNVAADNRDVPIPRC